VDVKPRYIVTHPLYPLEFGLKQRDTGGSERSEVTNGVLRSLRHLRYLRVRSLMS
jgi:hypothetical protein